MWSFRRDLARGLELGRAALRSLIFFLLLQSAVAWGEELPLWEIGVGSAGAMTPDYPGSSQSHIKWLPFPYAVYRGEVLRSDRSGGTRARVVKTEVYEINLSGSGGLPTNSGENQARLGMSDLDWTFELGPRVLIRLNQFESGALLKMGIALRSAFSTDGSTTRGQGFIFEPQLQLMYPRFPFKKTSLFANLSTAVTDQRYQSYYYEVTPEFQNSRRPAYRADAGYFRSELTLGTGFPIIEKSVSMALFVNYASYKGSANADSPLMRSHDGVSYGLAFIWVLKRSEAKAHGHDI